MKKITRIVLSTLMVGIIFISCSEKKGKQINTVEEKGPPKVQMNTSNDKRISLDLNPMQKNHQLINMRSHLEAVQNIIKLISQDEFEKASNVAYSKLGSTTEMKMMCASFGNREFENLGLDFHKSADELSEILKLKDKNKSLESLAKTINYCVSCHSVFKQ